MHIGTFPGLIPLHIYFHFQNEIEKLCSYKALWYCITCVVTTETLAIANTVKPVNHNT